MIQTHTSTQKIVAGLLSFAMVLTLVVGLTVVPAQAQTATTYTRNLTVGSRGDDVVSLQTMLEAQGYLVIPAGVAKGYFGSLTKAAVAKYQAAKGISPAVGYFGPITRAQVNGSAGTGTGTVVCPVGYTCTPAGGSTGGSTSNVEGTLDATLASIPTSDSNITRNTDVDVLGIQLKSKLGDVRVDRLDLQFQVNVGTAAGSEEHPATFVNTIKVKDGSNVIKTWSVTSSDFTKDSDGDYYIRLTDIGLVVPKDSTKNLIVSVNTSGGIDSNRVLVVNTYGTNELRVSSGNVIAYYDLSSVTRTHTFVKPGSSTLTVTVSGDNPTTTNHQITSTGVSGVEMLRFNAKSETSDSKITTVAVVASSSANAPTILSLYDGSTLLDSESVSSTTSSTVTFDNLNVSVAKDATKTLTVKADFPSTTNSGNYASTTLSSVTYEKPNGTSATASGSAIGNVQYFYSDAPVITLLSATASSAAANTNGSSTAITGTFVFKIKPVGGDITASTIATTDFIVNVASSTTAVPLTNKSVSISGNPTTLSEGVEYTVTLTGNAGDSDLTGLASGSVTTLWFTVSSFAWEFANSGSSATQTWGLDSFRTNTVTWVQ